MCAELPEGDRTRCEVWTRVMGYHRPVSQWNPGKQAEHRDRCPFLLPADLADSDDEDLMSGDEDLRTPACRSRCYTLAERIAFDQGACAGRVGWDLDACGYPVGSPLREVWLLGHCVTWIPEN